MGTLRQAISEVRGKSKLISGDNSINNRVIASALKNNAKYFIRQYTNKRLLWETDSIFTTIPCLEMQEVPIAECCTYTSNKKVSRSKYKLPSIAEGNYMYLIQGIYALDLNKKLIPTTINKYIDILRLKLKGNEIYYWISNNYIYCSSQFVQTLKIVAFIEDELDARIQFPECECSHSIIGNKCENPMDKEFPLPGFLLSPVIDKVVNELLGTYFKIPNDHTSDNKDDQVNKI